MPKLLPTGRDYMLAASVVDTGDENQHAAPEELMGLERSIRTLIGTYEANLYCAMITRLASLGETHRLLDELR